MTNERMTGIDIKKIILSNGLKPSDYDLQAVWEANPKTEYAVLVSCVEHPIDRGPEHDGSVFM